MLTIAVTLGGIAIIMLLPLGIFLIPVWWKWLWRDFKWK